MALAASGKGVHHITTVVPQQDRLASSVPDAREIADALQVRGEKLALDTSLYDPAYLMGKMFFNVLATFAECEGGLIPPRIRKGMTIARAKGRYEGNNQRSLRNNRRSCTGSIKPGTTRVVVAKAPRTLQEGSK